ncbi:hypothetical protein [Veillonella caviae]|uniref:hypothetical protein n=1 Tax=Veillonella caviae TaxID=248316 RepID=UPI002A912E19|nr:hypothetical protein [Veillonella caviae]MDY6225360.1 hypothetical protein [Veillonella caviae]
MGRKNRRKQRPANDVLSELAAEIIAKDKTDAMARPRLKRERVAKFDGTFTNVISGLFLLAVIITIVVFVKGVLL